MKTEETKDTSKLTDEDLGNVVGGGTFSDLADKLTELGKKAVKTTEPTPQGVPPIYKITSTGISVELTAKDPEDD